MKTAQAKIELLLDLLVEGLQDRFAETNPNDAIKMEFLHVELERLINLSNLNNKRRETTKEPGPQSKTPEISDADLLKELKAGRDPDLFPRRGPRKGKREDPGKPLPATHCSVHSGSLLVARADGVECPICKPTCAMHPDIACVENPNPNGKAMWSCPQCIAEIPTEGFVSLKNLLP